MICLAPDKHHPLHPDSPTHRRGNSRKSYEAYKLLTQLSLTFTDFLLKVFHGISVRYASNFEFVVKLVNT